MRSPCFRRLPRSFTFSFLVVVFGAVASPAFAHIVLAEPAALANTSYRATLRVGHGCDGASTSAIRVTMPTGFRGAKPMPKAGWVLSVKSAKLDQPYDDHGKPVTQDVSEISWTAASRDHWLPDAFYDEFVLRGLPVLAGPMWFKVLQTCDKASTHWAELPASGTSTDKLKNPAALLEVIPSEQAGGHQH